MTVINGYALLMAAPIKNMLSSKVREHGVSHGLAEVGYDIRLKQNVKFSPMHYREPHRLEGRMGYNVWEDTQQDWSTNIGRFTLASAIEEFDMPSNLVGIVHDKSTWVRRGLTVGNTVIEPGWRGFLTLELIYHGQEELLLPAGAGIALVIFHKLECAGQYEGKYQDQPDEIVDAIHDR